MGIFGNRDEKEQSENHKASHQMGNNEVSSTHGTENTDKVIDTKSIDEIKELSENRDTYGR